MSASDPHRSVWVALAYAVDMAVGLGEEEGVSFERLQDENTTRYRYTLRGPGAAVVEFWLPDVDAVDEETHPEHADDVDPPRLKHITQATRAAHTLMVALRIILTERKK